MMALIVYLLIGALCYLINVSCEERISTPVILLGMLSLMIFWPLLALSRLGEVTFENLEE